MGKKQLKGKQSEKRQTETGNRDGQKAMQKHMAKKNVEKQESFCYILISSEAPVRKILSLLSGYEKSAEIWTEWNVMELKLTNGFMFWEDAAEDFSAAEDQDYIREHGICQIYSVTFDMQDQEEARRILETVSADLGGRICAEEERL